MTPSLSLEARKALWTGTRIMVHIQSRRFVGTVPLKGRS
jgi:hypothetical protein